MSIPKTMKAVLLTGHGGPGDYVLSGKVKPLVAKTFALEEFGQAQVAFKKKEFVGKLVVSVSLPNRICGAVDG